MIRRLLTAAFLAGATAFAAAGAHAVERPLLRADITLDGPIATIGDFFENPGHLALTPLFRSPDLGQTGTVSAAFVLERAMASGLANPDPNGVVDVIVRRDSLEVTPEMIGDMLKKAVAERIGITDSAAIDIRFTAPLPHEQADPAVAVPLYIDALSYSPRSGRFDARLAIRQGHRDKLLSIAGTATETVEVPVLARSIGRGDTVTRQDLTTQRIPRNRLTDFVIADAEEVIGLVAQRAQQAERPLVSRDFRAPLMVVRREKVIITYSVPGMMLTVQGQALEDGSEGDTVEVLNAQSHRRLEATVTGPGRVTVITGASRVASLKEALQ